MVEEFSINQRALVCRVYNYVFTTSYLLGHLCQKTSSRRLLMQKDLFQKASTRRPFILEGQYQNSEKVPHIFHQVPFPKFVILSTTQWLATPCFNCLTKITPCNEGFIEIHWKLIEILVCGGLIMVVSGLWWFNKMAVMESFHP